MNKINRAAYHYVILTKFDIFTNFISYLVY